MSIFYSKSQGGFYDDSVHPTLPSDAVEITTTQWQTLLEGQSQGQQIVGDANGNPILQAYPAPALADVKTAALRQIDSDAETLRGLYITANSGQIATYIMKFNDASAFKTAGYAGTVPGLVQSEMAATGQTAQQAADAIIAQYMAWNTLAASIETVRRKAKVAVGAAADSAGVQTAVTTAETGFAQIQQAAGTQSI